MHLEMKMKMKTSSVVEAFVVASLMFVAASAVTFLVFRAIAWFQAYN
jgi:hypothetical protein